MYFYSLIVFWLYMVAIYGFLLPEDCTPSPLPHQGIGISLHCSLSAINSQTERTNFSLIPPNRTLSLTIACRDNLTPSQLEPGGFIDLRHLLHLEIRDCNLKPIPKEAFAGLTQLKALKIRSSSELKIENEAFAGLISLTSLDLSSNDITSLAEKSLCNLESLQLLNLSGNAIESTAHIGDPDCLNSLLSLKTLDLTFNSIWYLMLNNPVVENLHLGNNAVSNLEEDSLKGVLSLKKLDVSNNVLDNLPPGFISSSSSLQELILSNNSLVHISEDVFKNQGSLKTLDLSGNRLQSLSPKIFSGCSSSLINLDLSFNELQSMDAFSKLSSLQSLNLNNNALNFIPSLQSSGKTLKNLYVSHNSLGPRIQDRVLTGLESLLHLTMDHNGLEQIPLHFFINSSDSVSVLDLSHNNFPEIPSVVRSLHNLQSFSIGNNQITELGMLSMEHLWRLQADHNRLQRILASNFKDLKSLQVLDLSSNEIQVLEEESFQANDLLKAIRLDDNRLSSLSSIFRGLPNLTWLNLSTNTISAFDYRMAPKTIQWLDLHNNRLKSLDNHFSLEDLILLGHLDASFNQIQEIGPQSIPDNIVTLLLNDNHISRMDPYTFFKKKNLKKVDLTLNRMESISSNALRLSSELSSSAEIEFYFGGNPIKCDCQMTWFKSINSANSIQKFPIVADLESIYCELTYSREQSFVPLVDAIGDSFLCEYRTHCFALCRCCEYDACDCEMTCPSNCTCYHDNSWAKNIAECSFSDLKGLPDRLPMDATEIFLDGNDINVVQSHTFIGRKNLRSLYLNESHVRRLPNNSFNGLVALEVLHLENNELSRLEGSEFSGLIRLRELYLQNNLINFVRRSTFKELKALRTLHIHGNHISSFPPWILMHNPLLRTISLGDNPWNCECRFMKPFEQWLSAFKGQVINEDSLSCIKGILIKSNACPLMSPVSRVESFSEDSERRVVEYKPKGRDLLLPLVISSAVILSLLVIFLILVLIYRYEIRVWFFSHFGVRLFDRTGEDELFLEKDKLYDAFFAYSNKDDVFVREVLAPELEHGSQEYKICLLYRDLPTQPSYVADTIVQASGEARRTIIILSDNFLKSEWSRYNYKSGLHQACGTFKNARHLIVIILGNVCLRDLDSDIRHYFSSSLILRWGDKLFWDKLKYSLPDVEETSPNEATSVINLQDVRHSMNNSSSAYSFNNYDSCQQSDSSIRTMTIHI